MGERFEISIPRTWPLKWRRIFLLTLPISGLIYIVGHVLFAAFILVIAFPAMMIFGVVEWIRNLWTAPLERQADD